MLDMKWVREHYNETAEMLASRNNTFPLDRYIKLDEDRRNILLKVEKLKERRNSGFYGHKIAQCAQKGNPCRRSSGFRFRFAVNGKAHKNPGRSSPIPIASLDWNRFII